MLDTLIGSGVASCRRGLRVGEENVQKIPILVYTGPFETFHSEKQSTDDDKNPKP